MAKGYSHIKEESDGNSTSCAGICAALCGVCCSCCCCLASIAIIILLIAIGHVGWIILGSALAIFVLVFVLVYCLHQFVIEGTHFTIFNYFLPFLKYGLVSQFKGERGVRNFWKSMAIHNGSYVARGIGPNTLTYFGWQEAAKMLSSWGTRIQDDTMVRHNELGTAIMGSGPFPELGRLCLAYTTDEHRLCRPIIARAVDGSQQPDSVPCDGSNGWNRAYLRRFFREKFDSCDTFNTKDTLWWCTQVFHKIHLNMDLSDEEAQEFLGFPCGMSFPGTSKMGVSLANITDRERPLIQCFTPLPCFRCKVQSHTDEVKDALQEKYPEQNWDDEELKLMAGMFMTSLLYAGGLSVPTILQNMLAWWHCDDDSLRPPDLQRVRQQDEDSIKDFFWETLRRNPPVAGVPRWVLNDDGEWNHEVANVEQAMQDERVFPDPFTFKMGRPGLNAQDYSRSMTWADQAIVGNDTCHPDSHICPGKMLTIEVCVAFWQEYLQEQWYTDATGVKVAYNLTSTFDVTRG